MRKPKRRWEEPDEVQAIRSRLKQARLNAGLTQEQASNSIGISHHQTISFLERGSQRLEVMLLYQLSKSYDVDYQYILTGVSK